MFRAFRFPDFRWFILSQGCSLIGSWMQQVALAWLVYRITGSGFFLGLSGSMSTLPSVFVAPIAGVLADTFDRRKIVLVTQLLTLIQAVILALLVWTQTVTMPGLLALSVSLGLIQGFDWPARQSLLVRLVKGQADLGNAIALNSTVFNLARFVGPSLAGAILAAGVDSACFFLNAACGGLALFCMFQIRAAPIGKVSPNLRLVQEMAAGASYIWREPEIRRAITLVAVASGCVMPYTAMLPLFATRIFDGDARLFALLAATPAVGAIGGGLVLAARRNTIGLARQIQVVGFVASTSLILFALSRWLPLSMAALALLGGSMMLWTSSLNTQLQTSVPEAKRGRVMSFFTIALMGALPMGYFVFGSLAERVGVTTTVVCGGVAALAGNLWLHRDALTRQASLFRRKAA